MIRIFNHYLHRQTLLSVLSDLGFVVLVMLVVFATQADSLRAMLPMAGPQVVSLAAGLFVINTASGLYQRAPNFTAPQALARAALALMLALPMTWLLFGLLPSDLDSRSAIRLAAPPRHTIKVTPRTNDLFITPLPLRFRTRETPGINQSCPNSNIELTRYYS